ncbi:aminopeptidase O isoform X2 [Patella vulgata]|uniref:aminopeptidase O isoform X2 n=1 Tax=Patella vulgata TaxID=6465 RepID=UPI0024A96214|nr:aminopeptidase O isoform X2 [Patella vulgata]
MANAINSTTGHELDLPLSANIRDIIVHHFILDWNCDVKGTKSIILFLRPATDISNDAVKRNMSDEITNEHQPKQSPQDILASTTCNPTDIVKSKQNLTDEQHSQQSDKDFFGHTTGNSNYTVKNKQILSDPGTSEHRNKQSTQDFLGKQNPSDPGTDEQHPERSTQDFLSKENPLDPGTDEHRNKPSTHDILGKQNPPDPRTSEHRNKQSTQDFLDKQNPSDPGTSEPHNKPSTHNILGKQNPPDPETDEQHPERSTRDFVLILDCCDLEIISVEELKRSDSFRVPHTHVEKKADIKNENGFYMSHMDQKGQPLEFVVEKHCLKTWKPGVSSVSSFPEVVQIKYAITANGKSFKWTKDVDGKSCGFTIGHWINNRSLFPSQDAPSAMPTWQAIIRAETNQVVLMSGDETGKLIDKYSSDELKAYFFYTSMSMPTSTLAIACGEWTEVVIVSRGNDTDDVSALPSCRKHGANCQTNFSSNNILPCRLFLPESLKDAGEELNVYLPSCMNAVKDILGPHPFQRLDILIVPECFDSLGMASPSLLFLSQSVLSGDYSMFHRVAHELCHSWFGLLIGPKDWTEEWMTEGFCTYLEDIVHAKALKWERDVTDEFIELRSLLRYKILSNELEHTEGHLQLLRPNQGSVSSENEKFVKHGMNPEKGFMQVHYLKGYFLLRYLEETVGREAFLHFLKKYVVEWHGELVLSQEFMKMFLDNFLRLRVTGMSEDYLCSEWLDYPGIPLPIKNFPATIKSKNRMIIAVNKELNADQKVLLLEELLNKDNLPENVFTCLRQQYNIDSTNAEVYHRMCELIIKHKYTKYFPEIERFLKQHQSMGVYLYGEMMLSENQKLIEMSRRSFSLVKNEMPDGVFSTVHAMLYGD